MFLPSLHCGGAERMAVNLLCGLADAGIAVDLLLANAEGPFLADVPSAVRVIDFQARHVRHAVWPLARYLRRERPHCILSRLPHANVATLLARRLARTRTRVVVLEDSALATSRTIRKTRRGLQTLMSWLYPTADAIIAVSRGVAAALEAQLQLAPGTVRVIPNPVVSESLLSQASQLPEHPWLLDASIPVFLAVGRLNIDKDFGNLLRAFALVRRQRRARLLILGEGEERRQLESLVDELGLQNDVALPGFSRNTCAAMRGASAFVLSSRSEGLPSVLIEALACGCPAVSTDCPSGPNEILAGGKYGVLVPCANPQALAEGMIEVLERQWDRRALQARAADFSIERALPQYLQALDLSAAVELLAEVA
jgi:glycosyltransferase involved in cell wall biosynthesis